MKKNFRSENFSRIVCTACEESTTIEPGHNFNGLNCKCGDNLMSDTEISTPVKEELDYIKTNIVIVIGRFENGDYEVCNDNNIAHTWRVPKDTFEYSYKLAPKPKPTTLTLEELEKKETARVKAK
tara:strand:+ start:1485 stop:1859 length:375 start_codon:yes stop_codon:yes gene_type:complete